MIIYNGQIFMITERYIYYVFIMYVCKNIELVMIGHYYYKL